MSYPLKHCVDFVRIHINIVMRFFSMDHCDNRLNPIWTIKWIVCQ